MAKSLISFLSAIVFLFGFFDGGILRARARMLAPTQERAESMQEPEDADTCSRRPLFALTNNFFFENVTSLTGFHTVPLAVGLEFPIGKHWSTYAQYICTAPWHAWNNNAECVELMHLYLGGRWYPGGNFLDPFHDNGETRVLQGWYASFSVGIGYYDLELDGKGYQGEEIVGALGVGYGIALNDYLSLNLGLGFGPLVTRYRYYEGRSSNEHLMFQYPGWWIYSFVTDAQVTLTWLLYNEKNKKARR